MSSKINKDIRDARSTVREIVRIIDKKLRIVHDKIEIHRTVDDENAFDTYYEFLSTKIVRQCDSDDFDLDKIIREAMESEMLLPISQGDLRFALFLALLVGECGYKPVDKDINIKIEFNDDKGPYLIFETLGKITINDREIAIQPLLYSDVVIAAIKKYLEK
jgi:hypothetical protein